jgi:hypothetical protein
MVAMARGERWATGRHDTSAMTGVYECRLHELSQAIDARHPTRSDGLREATSRLPNTLGS